METQTASKARLSLTSIHENITFSKTAVWAWISLPIQHTEYNNNDTSAMQEHINSVLTNYAMTNKRLVKYHFVVSSHHEDEFPSVLLGVKIGNRSSYSSNKIMPVAFDNLINLIADAPVDDYISNKEVAYWQQRNIEVLTALCNSLGAMPAASDEIAYAIRKNFYPAMAKAVEYDIDQHLGIWGENEIASLFDAKITNHPKYLTITQDIGGLEVVGYRASLDIVKPSESMQFPSTSLWLKNHKDIPFAVDFSIRFSIQGDTISKKPKKVSESFKLSIETSSTEELKQKVSTVIVHYEERDTLVVWATGDQMSLLNESLPNGENPDKIVREKHNELSLTHIFDNVTFSKNDVWAWVEIPPAQYEFLDDDSRIRLAQSMDLALANLVTSDEKGVECHMIVSSRPFDSLVWVRNLNNQVTKNDPVDYNEDFLYNMYEHVTYQDYREKIVLLGINLGKRISYAPNKSVSPGLLENAKYLVTAPPVTNDISEKELEYWKHLARQITFALGSSHIHAIAAETKDIAYAIRKNFYPSMQSPSPDELAVGLENEWNREEVVYLADAQIENHPKYLKITQEINGVPVVGYRATLCFARFPEVMHFPQWEPWIHYANLLPFPADFSLRYTLEPSRKVRKEVDHKLKEAQDQANNMASAGGQVSLEVGIQIQQGIELDYALKKDTTPWVFGRYRLTIEADSVDALQERAKQVIDHYRSMEIFVTWPTGDQLSLLKESLPNDKIRVASYHQRQELSIIAAGMPAGSGSTGDKVIHTAEGETRGWIGHYLGYTTGRIQEPVFLSMHSTIDANNAPGLVITGSPGGGKTFAALTMTYQMALSGVWTIYIDPKADALAMKRLPGLESTKIIDLQNGNDGILDPFSIGHNLSAQMDLALETVGLFLGGLDNLTDGQNIALSQAIESMARYPGVTLSKIVDYLMHSPDKESQNLGVKLNVIRKLPFAQLCFSSNTSGETLNPEDGLTIVTLLGLDLPPATLDSSDYGSGNRLAVGVMYLLSSFTRQLMLNADKGHPKAIIIDEAWAVTSTRQGAKLVAEVARMGRSHNTALILVSQNAGDFTGDSVTNSVSTKMAFRATQPDEINNIMEFLNIEPSDSNRDSIRGLANGECLIRDWSGRIARVKVDGWDEGMRHAFESNPQARDKP
jgi:hypothetical protein